MTPMEQSGSMIEIEVKLRVESAAAALSLLEMLPASLQETRVFEDNEIFDTPEGALTVEHRLLRLRTVGDSGLITWKEKVETELHAKVRSEIQTGVTSPDAARAILVKMGYERVYRYQKHRTCFRWADPAGAGLAITLDETPIGVYLELEGPAAAIDEAARRMGFTEADYIVDDYHTLHRSWLQSQGLPESDMVFAAQPGSGDGS